jgi:hypothetical protein
MDRALTCLTTSSSGELPWFPLIGMYVEAWSSYFACLMGLSPYFVDLVDYFDALAHGFMLAHGGFNLTDSLLHGSISCT